MAADARGTVFVTGADGFLGTELVKILVARGHQVFALARSTETAQSVRCAGAMPVIGDLLTPGRWQDEAAAEWVFHLLPTSSPSNSAAGSPQARCIDAACPRTDGPQPARRR